MVVIALMVIKMVNKSSKAGKSTGKSGLLKNGYSSI